MQTTSGVGFSESPGMLVAPKRKTVMVTCACRPTILLHVFFETEVEDYHNLTVIM
jgi:hypothetical protein